MHKQLRNMNGHSGLGGVSGLSIVSNEGARGKQPHYPGAQYVNVKQQSQMLRNSIAFHHNKPEVNNSELETQENTFDKAEEIVSTKAHAKQLSSLGYITQAHNSGADLPNVEKKDKEKEKGKETKLKPSKEKDDSDPEEDVFAKD